MKAAILVLIGVAFLSIAVLSYLEINSYRSDEEEFIPAATHDSSDPVSEVTKTFNEYSSAMHNCSDELHDCVNSLKYCSEGFGQSVRTLQELVKRYPSLAYDIGEIDEIHAPDAGIGK